MFRMATAGLIVAFFAAACGDDTTYEASPADAGVDDVSGADGGGDVSTQPDASGAVCADGSTTSMLCPDSTEVPQCTCAGGQWQCEADPSNLCVAPCDDGSQLACRIAIPDCRPGLVVAVIDGCYECVEPATCRPPSEPTACVADVDCADSERCDRCATSSCPECDDCVAGCVAHGCDPGPEPLCNGMRPSCSEGGVAVVRDGCWRCVSVATCEPMEPSECESVGGYCSVFEVECDAGFVSAGLSCSGDGGQCCVAVPCSDGTALECRMSPPVCEAMEELAIVDGCWECVNAATCLPWGESGCAGDIECQAGHYCDECATGSCPMCEDCVAACVAHGCDTGGQAVCPEPQPECGPQGVAVARDGCWQCVNATTCEPLDQASQCESEGGYCTDFDGTCTQGYIGVDPRGCPQGRSAMCCLPRTTECDDGTEPMCNMLPPVCAPHEVLAIRDSCWVCVNPSTCVPWAEPGCNDDMGCSEDSYCDGCATSSCPGCLDCVAGCVPHGCDTEAQLTCRCARPDCGDGATSVIVDGCWQCVTLDSCAPVSGGCN